MTQAVSKSIKLDYIRMVNFEGNVTDIRNLVSEFSIYENLFSNYLTGYLVMLDNIGFLERFPIIGEEFVELSFRTPEQKKLTYTFAVYKVENVQNASNNTTPSSLFTINLVSPHLIVSNTTTVEDSYIGLNCSTIIQSIHDTYFNRSDKKYSSIKNPYLLSTPIELEETDGLVSIVSPLSTPFELIQHCVKHSRSIKYPESDFVYYQDVNGFHLKTLSSLMEQDSVEDYYVAEASNSSKLITNQVKIKDYQIVASFERVLNFDVLNRQRQGMYDNTVISIDPLLKRYSETNINYLDPNVNFVTTNTRDKLSTENSIHASSPGNSHSRYLISNISSGDYKQQSYLNNKIINGSEIKDNDIAYPSQRHKYLPFRISKISQLIQGLRLNLSLPGNSELKVGQNINFHFPQTSGASDETEENFLFGKENKSKFIITALNHFYNVTENDYFTNIEIAKNGFGSKIKNRI